MRGCLTLLIGIGVGVAIMAFAWPTTPRGSTLPPDPDVHVSLGDGYLTRIVRARLASTGVLSIHGLQVRSAPPVLVVRAEASVGPLSAPITAELQPIAASGDVQVRIIATHVGIIPVPNVLMGLVASSINGSLHRALGRHATVTGVTTTARGLDITANYP